MKRQLCILGLLFVTLMGSAQDKTSLQKVRLDFQRIESEADIEKLLDYDYNTAAPEEQELIQAYLAAGTCMMANYVFSPLSKLKYFNEGKEKIEELIREDKQVENIYLRLLIQLNVPRILNYNRSIEEDLAFLKTNLAGASIEQEQKRVMISNLMSIAKKNEHKDVLRQINIEPEG